MQQMEVRGVYAVQPDNRPFVVLATMDGETAVLIWVGTFEASAIRMALDGEETHRPLTHDLFVPIIEALGSSVLRVEVTELRERTFIGKLVLGEEGETVRVGGRPSDLIAIAVRADAEVTMANDGVESAGVPMASIFGGLTEVDIAEQIDEIRVFLDEVIPEDFEDPEPKSK